MANGFEKFSEKARRVFSIAQEEVSERSQNYISAEHLILGLMRETEGLAARILKNLNVDFYRLRESIEMVIGKQQAGGSSVTDIRLSPRTQRILSLAVNEATRLKQQYIGTEHLLVAVLRDVEEGGDVDDDKGSTAGKLLIAMGVTLEKVLKEIENLGKASDAKSRVAPRRKPSRRSSQYPNASSVIEKYGVNLTKEAAKGNLDVVIGREKEIERLVQVVSRRIKNNPVLIGEPGVGKTAIVEKFAQMVTQGEVPEFLLEKQVVTLSMGALVAGTKYRGEFEDRLQKIINEIRSSPNYILFIDEMHTIIGAGAAEGSVDAANILKPALARGELQVIGATTIKDYRKYVERDPAFERRFQTIVVDPPSAEDTIEILKGVRNAYEDYHGVKIDDEAVETAVRLSERYITDRQLPDKAIDVMDEAAANTRIKKSVVFSELRAAEKSLENIRQRKADEIAEQNYEAAADLRDKELRQIALVEETRTQLEGKRVKRTPKVSPDNIANIISLWTQIPVTRLRASESRALLKLGDKLKKVVIGQDEAVDSIAQAVRRSGSGIKNPNRPAGVFLFSGPTGVGKTYIVKQLSKLMFGDEKNIVRLDMSEYIGQHTVTRLIGAPPSYVGYEDGGQLTEAVRRKPNSIILLDEIEKAHPDVFNVFLQVMEDGHLTDSKGRRVDFKNTIIIMTSNIGSDQIQSASALGFGGAHQDTATDYEVIKNRVLDAMKSPSSSFKPEFINRIDETVVFRPLKEEHILEIADLMLNEVRGRVLEQDISFNVDIAAQRHLVKHGFDAKMGARSMRRKIQTEIEDVLSQKMLEGAIKAGDTVEFRLQKDQIAFEVKSPPPSAKRVKTRPPRTSPSAQKSRQTAKKAPVKQPQ